MDSEQDTPRNVTGLAITVEFGLAVLAIALAWLMGRPPLAGLDFSSTAINSNLWAVFIGILATVPMLLILPIVQRSNFQPIVRLRNLVDEMIVPMFAETTVIQMAVISLAAGVGEEMLFRGLLQESIADGIGGDAGMWIGLIIASLVFGACHWLTTTYAVLATGIGIYMGLLFVLTGNLIVPIVAHGLYDFLALVYLVKCRSVSQPQMSTAPITDETS